MVRPMELFVDVWLPIGIAVVGVGGTIAVTALQLNARRNELSDERASRLSEEQKRRREAIIASVYDAIGPLTSAAVVPSSERTRVPVEVTTATATVVREIRLAGRDDRQELQAWWNSRARDFGKAKLSQLEDLEAATLQEIDAWFDETASASQIRSLALSRAL